MVFSSQLFPSSMMVQLEEAGLVEPSAAKVLTESSLSMSFAMPGVRQWWELEGLWFPDFLQMHIATILAENDQDGTIVIAPAAQQNTSADPSWAQVPNAMNWDAIGAVAETLGAVGVIASLVADSHFKLRFPHRR
jgi:hypothetical protein